MTLRILSGINLLQAPQCLALSINDTGNEIIIISTSSCNSSIINRSTILVVVVVVVVLIILVIKYVIR